MNHHNFLFSTVVVDRAEMSISYKQNQVLFCLDEAKSCTTERAQEVQAYLDPGFPSFVKSMSRSHVTCGFWLGLPSQFCSAYLPKRDVMMTLVDEDREAYSAKFLSGKFGLSGGWKGFSVAHELVEGDALVFQLVKSDTFQVYILRAHSLSISDGALGLLALHAGMSFRSGEENKRERWKSIMAPHEPSIRESSSDSEETVRKRQRTIMAPRQPVAKESSGDNSEVVTSESFEGVFLETAVKFKDVTDLDSFVIEVNGSPLDCAFPTSERAMYYELCCSQNCLLHERLLKGINIKLVLGAISETVEIAGSIKASNLGTSGENFTTWDARLKALQELGMNVGFLRDRIQELQRIAYGSEKVLNTRQYHEAITGRDNLKNVMKTLVTELEGLKKTSKKLDLEIETLERLALEKEIEFKERVDAPW